MAQAEQDARPTGIFLNPMARRRDAFDAACGDLFARLDSVDSVDMAARLIAQDRPDLLVIDLERFEPGIDLDAVGALVAHHGATLVLCPCASARWLPALMARGPLAYAMTPADPARLRAGVAAVLASGGMETDSGASHGLLALRSRVQATLDAAADLHDFSEGLCAALCAWPGVLHAAVLARQPDGNLRLAAQQGEPGLVLGKLLGRTEGLLGAPLRHAFPGLLAAVTGEMAFIDTPDAAGEPDLAAALRAHGVAMAVGLPIPADGPGPARGALSLLFGAGRAAGMPFDRDAFAALEDVARLAAFGMRLAETVAENDSLLARLTYVSTMDALTGVANRRHGEDLLDKEIRRARRYRLPLALIAFDIDRFKLVNDTYGYPVGDVALRTVADAAKAVLRGSDILVRSGGEEFHIVAPHTSAIDGLKVAEKVRVAIAQTPIPGCDHLTVSLGVAQLGEEESGDSLTRRADAALARAKRAGRNCVELAMG
jgi:diguanylate cyclase (GGDEF)-like protein